ncbi:hypothetical protein M409DRAFT_24889 [Zasmidium cellare ATCC 36951]|uniref:NACHT domain-containing protein n=1 Tax=Zasmidium cellare ATCC 36951 TaxID=1080233 RepID=A0A6A6CFQ5_ZASCE|nr:uncharacterized protein M409DRAFT_24889 [Zasmidium cellare ATCC 36951]KAF2164988.1 hypothetical protein M409DRAFT_24889 [Zasmidium cellare ATCC 36951]
MNARFCFFIDGLNEYTDDHYELVQYLQLLVASKVVKLCVSSRPWNAFTSAFGNIEDRTLVLQTLTRSDMRDYMKGMLEGDPRFMKLAQADDRAHDLTTEIQKRAQGVFLWVFLVVRSLLRGLTEQDDIPMLQKRLRQLPTDLEHFFQLILDSIDSVYQECTARALLIVFESGQPLSMMAFWYLDTDLEKPDFALKLDIKPLPKESDDRYPMIVAARVNKWCRDLLEVVWTPTDDSGEDIVQLFKDTLVERAGPDFNASLAICRLYLALAKSVDPAHGDDDDSDDDDYEALQPFQRICDVIMRAAATYEIKCNETPFRLLEELRRVGQHYHQWGAPWSSDDDDSETSIENTDFLSLAKAHGLKLYLRRLVRLQQGIDDPGESGLQATAGAGSLLMPPARTHRISVSSRGSSVLRLPNAAAKDGATDDGTQKGEKRRSWRMKFKQLWCNT